MKKNTSRIQAKELQDSTATGGVESTSAWAQTFEDLGLPAYRVQVKNDTVCIFVPPKECDRILATAVRKCLVAKGKELGHRFVTLGIDHQLE